MCFRVIYLKPVETRQTNELRHTAQKLKLRIEKNEKYVRKLIIRKDYIDNLVTFADNYGIIIINRFNNHLKIFHGLIDMKAGK